MAVSQSDLTTVDELLKNGPSELLAWIRQVQAGEKVVPESFNWLGLAEVASQEATTAPSPRNLEWAHLAIAIYELLAAQESSWISNTSTFLSAMLLRARMIKQCGSLPGDSVLDPNAILGWFFEGLMMSPQEAAVKAENWQQKANLAEIRTLRQIKNRLGVLQHLLSVNPSLASDEIRSWLALRDKLP